MAARPPKRRGPGRPPGGNADATRAAILNAAIAHFGRRGRDGASLRNIAKDAEVSLSTVMHHYGDKGQLFVACVDATFATLATTQDDFVAAVATAESPWHAVQPVVGIALDFAFAHKAFVRVVLTEVVSSGRVPGAVWERVVGPTLDRIASALSLATGRSRVQIRLLSMTLSHTVARYALAPPDELARITGLGGDGTDDDGGLDPRIRAALEDHVSDIVMGALRGAPMDPT